MQDLRNRFHNTWKNLGGEKPDIFFNELTHLYTEPQRVYHNLAHIKDALSTLDDVIHLTTNPSLVEMALFWHDAIYDAKRYDNEIASAILARDRMMLAGINKDISDTVQRLIYMTDHKTQPEHIDEEFIADIDLAILGADDKTYDEYARKIRQEYAIYTDDEYYAGRCKVIAKFLDRDNRYHTDYFRERYDEQAKKNLKRELIQLSIGRN